VRPLSAAEMDEMSTLLVRVGKAGNEAVGRSGGPKPVGKSGIDPPGSVKEGSPALRIGNSGSDGSPVGASKLGTETPGGDGSPVGKPALGGEIPGSEGNADASRLGTAPAIDVSTMGGGMAPALGREAGGRLATGGIPTPEKLGRIAGRGKAGEAEAWIANAASDSRMC
jgi:hypothetical protein